MEFTKNIILNDSDKNTFTFNSLANLLDFITKEAEFWNKINSSSSHSRSPRCFDIGVIAFDKLLVDLTSIKKPNNNPEQVASEAMVFDLIQSIQPQLSKDWVYRNNEYTNQLIQVYELFGTEAADSFLVLVTNKGFYGVSTKDHFFGTMAAYNYLYQDKVLSGINNSIKSRNKRIIDELHKTHSSLTNKIEKDKSLSAELFEELKQKLLETEIETKNKSDSLIIEIEQKGEERLRKLDAAFNHNINEHNSRSNDLANKSAKELSDLEKAHKDYLSLALPAKYWKEKAKNYKKEGVVYSRWLTFLIIGGVALLGILFSFWIDADKAALNKFGLQGVLIFGSLLAAYAFGLRVFSRLTFSSFHLMRDAEERRQLTNFYLSLQSRGAVDEDSRSLIIQSLFSRSESGLLGGESTPTMPTISEALKAVPKS